MNSAMHVVSSSVVRRAEPAETTPPPAPVSGVTTRPSGFHRSRRTLVTASAAMEAVIAALARLAPTDVTVTLVGETGTGKDLLAHSVHENSPRAREPFVIFDCASVAQNLAETELLGHERGAFTGAHAAHQGAFERADGG